MALYMHIRHYCSSYLLLLTIILTCYTQNSLCTSDQVPHQDDNGQEQLEQEVDPKGYIAYCPCMGRFGNQADQFLGALAFAKGLDRTLILPPWVEYIPYQAGSLQVPFKTYFNVSVVADYHKVIPMEIFMEKLAPHIWPHEKRISFCYQPRSNSKGCDAKDGNPFGPFWDRFNIDFVKSEFFGPDLHYTSYSTENDNWGRYNPENWPVLAFVGPPSMFPVEGKNVHLQEYLKWSTSIEEKANAFISQLPRGPFIGIHLRNGMDWSRACDLVKDSTTLFSSQQCTGYRNEHGTLTPEMCFPSPSTIIKQVKRGVRKIKATSVFVAADSNHMISELSKELKGLGATVHKLPYESPHVDLAILGQSNLWIGNCVSSFSAFVKRERDVNGFPSEFWAFPQEKSSRKNSKTNHEEL